MPDQIRNIPNLPSVKPRLWSSCGSVARSQCASCFEAIPDPSRMSIPYLQWCVYSKTRLCVARPDSFQTFQVFCAGSGFRFRRSQSGKRHSATSTTDIRRPYLPSSCRRRKISVDELKRINDMIEIKTDSHGCLFYI